MGSCRFESVIVIGCGNIVCTALPYMARLKEKYSFDLLYICHETQGLNAAEGICQEEQIPILRLFERKGVTAFLTNVWKKTWVVSAGNYYIFPKEVVDKENLTVTNFHNALLPKYPGRNAPSWAIYHNEKESGATWHFVTSDVDAGRIIWQGKCSINEHTRAYELTQKIMELAQQGLESFAEDMLNREVPGTAQNVCQRKMYYSYEVPGAGRFSLEDSAKDIYRLLRSMDYGKFGPFGRAVTQLPDGKTVEITRYKPVPRSEDERGISVSDAQIVMSLDEQTDLLLKYKAKE